MAEGTALSVSRVELLTDKNYFVWALKVRALLRARKLFKEVIENPEPPTSANLETPEGKARQIWESKNDEAFGILIMTISEEQAGQFLVETKAKNLWEELRKLHEGNAQDRKIDIGLELKNIRMQSNESVSEYITRAKNIASRSATLGYPIELREVSYHVVRGIHPKLEKVATVLRTQRNLKLEEIQQALLEEERHSTQTRSVENTTWKDEKAYRATRQINRRQDSYSGCYICGKQNHKAKECFHKKDRNDTSSNNRKTGKYRNYSSNNDNFNKKGIIKREQSNMVLTNRNHYNFQVTRQNRNRCMSEKNSNTQIWTLDSGATNHMSPNLSAMTNVRPLNIKVDLAEDNRNLSVEAQGDLEVRVETKQGNRIICIRNIFYIPTLRTNLLSVSQLTRNGYRISFEDKCAEITGKRNEIVAEGYEQDGVFLIETVVSNNRAMNVTANLRASDGKSLSEKYKEKDKKQGHSINKSLWHRRLGHVCEKYLDLMKNKEVVRDLQFPSEPLKLCEPCVMGKLTETPHALIKESYARQPLELIHIDLCGPMPVGSLCGNRYIFVIVDDGSRYTSVYTLKSKDEAFKYFIEFMNRCEKQLGKVIKYVRSDNGREFVNRNFENLFREKGIVHQRTVAYNPQSNGIAERMNRALLEKARAMLIDAELPNEFWAEAIMTAAYLKNLTPTRATGGRTPIEVWRGKKPTVSYLKAFGCMTYYYVPKNIRSKLQPRALRGILIGYSTESRAYRVYRPDNGKIYAVRTAKFNESEMGSKLLSEKNISDNKVEDIIYTTIELPDPRVEQGPEQQTEAIIEERIETQPSRQVGEENEEINEPEQLETRRGRKPGQNLEQIRRENKNRVQEIEEGLLERGVRRSERVSKRREQANEIVHHERQIPGNQKQAMQSSEAEEWADAMEKELESMAEHQVWRLVPREGDIKVIKSKWVYTLKGEQNQTPRYKARLVAMGCQQRQGIHYSESFAPVIKMQSVRTLLAIASVRKLRIKQFDVTAAYLYGTLEEDVYMEQPPGFENGKNEVCKLSKSIYGLPQSGRQWNERMNEIMKAVGMERMKEDPCVYVYHQGRKVIILGVYVDDFIVVGTDTQIIDDVINKIRKSLTLTESENKNFLSLEILETENGLELSQTSYVTKIIEKYGLLECNSAKTPLDPQQDLDNFIDSPKADSTLFQEMLGSLMYLSVGTRPDISYSVSKLSQYCKDPRQIHLAAMRRIYKYIKGTSGHRLNYDNISEELSISTDASWNSSIDAKSFGGYVVKIGNNLISWKSKKQDLVAMSTCEAELIALYDGLHELKWVHGLLTGININIGDKLPIELRTDSRAAMEWVAKERVTNRTKHINRKYYGIKDDVKAGFIKLTHVMSEDMEADALTKSLTGQKLTKNMQSIGLYNVQVSAPKGGN